MFNFFFLFNVCVLSHFSHVQLFLTLWTVAHQASLSLGFSRQEYWSGLPCPPSGDFPDPGIKPYSLMSPSLAGEFFTTSTTWEALKQTYPSNDLNSFKVAYKTDRSIVLQKFRITATNYISVKLKLKKELWSPNWVVIQVT